ncbi:MAG TPA: hypothetical protein VKR83_04170 [Ktedonobacteraceae bacterium]|nr:hypothetical protein [Ktedonobacteraceae bacterium]
MTDRLKKEEFVQLLATRMNADEATATAWVDGIVETRIEWRGRDHYKVACQYLISIRRLYQNLGKSNEWTTHVAALRDQHRNLPALRDEMAKAKL